MTDGSTPPSEESGVDRVRRDAPERRQFAKLAMSIEKRYFTSLFSTRS